MDKLHIYIYIYIVYVMFSFLLPLKEEAWWWALTFPKQSCEHVCVSNLRNKTETNSSTCPLSHVTDCDESSQGRMDVIQRRLLCANTWIQQMATLFLRHQNRLLGAPPMRYGQHPPTLQSKNSHQTRVWAMTMWLIVAMVIWSLR